MNLVVDASAAIEILFKRNKAKHFSELIASSKKTIAPHFYKAELANVLWKYYQAGLIERKLIKELLSLGLGLIDEYYDLEDLSYESIHEAIQKNHPVYDMYYFVLSKREGAKLLTLDKKLRDIAELESLNAV